MKSYITDIDGILVGHCHDEKMGKGVTAVICKEGATPGVDVRGSAPGTRETDLIKSEKSVDRIHSIVLSGGSAYGLEASSGVMQFLEEKNIGFKTPFSLVPIVSQAVIYDLNSGDSKLRPDKNMGYKAAESASSSECSRGCVGAGYGASVSKTLGWDKAIKSGLGSYTIKFDQLYVSALVVVNALGDVYKDGRQITGPYDRTEKKMYSAYDALKKTNIGFNNTNTTIGIIATNGILNKPMANKLASMGHDGYARAIKPVHTMSDGDTVFAMATNKVEVENFDLLLALAADAMELAIHDAITSSKSINGYLSYSDMKKDMDK